MENKGKLILTEAELITSNRRTHIYIKLQEAWEINQRINLIFNSSNGNQILYEVKDRRNVEKSNNYCEKQNIRVY